MSNVEDLIEAVHVVLDAVNGGGEVAEVDAALEVLEDVMVGLGLRERVGGCDCGGH